MTPKKKRARTALKKRSIGSKPKGKLDVKRFAVVAAVAVFVIYFVYIVARQQFTLADKNREIDKLREEISVSAQENEELKKELDNLEDPEYLERIAREKLGLVRPNERVFVDANKSESNISD